jgi:CheY-specific phosphatase CheX
MVDIERIRLAFHEATVLTLSKMMMLDEIRTCDTPALCEEEVSVSALIGFVGGVNGTAALRFGDATVRQVVRDITGEEPSAGEEAGGAVELVSIIANNAKNALPGLNLQMSLPEWVRGSGHTLHFSRHHHRLDLHYLMKYGPVWLIVAFGPCEPE